MAERDEGAHSCFGVDLGPSVQQEADHVGVPTFGGHMQGGDAVLWGPHKEKGLFQYRSNADRSVIQRHFKTILFKDITR